jgi:hypothetical protein
MLKKFGEDHLTNKDPCKSDFVFHEELSIYHLVEANTRPSLATALATITQWFDANDPESDSPDDEPEKDKVGFFIETPDQIKARLALRDEKRALRHRLGSQRTTALDAIEGPIFTSGFLGPFNSHIVQAEPFKPDDCAFGKPE